MIGKIQAMLIVVILSFASCVGFVLYQNFSLNPDNLMKLVGIEGEDIIYVEGTGERKDYIVSHKLSYDIKLSSSETQAFVQSDCKALKLQIKMIQTQIIYFEESIKTLDNLGFAIKNKIEIMSNQLI